jgi:hypothetical protein
LKTADPATLKRRQDSALRNVELLQSAKLRVDLDLISAGGKENEGALKAKEAFLDKALREAKSHAEEVGVVSSELEVKRAEVDQAEELVKRLRLQKMLMEVEIQSAKKRIIVIHRAAGPDVPEPKP